MLIIVYPLEIASDKKKERTPPAPGLIRSSNPLFLFPS